MSRVNIALAVLIAVIAFIFVVNPIVHATVNAMNRTANAIAEAGR